MRSAQAIQDSFPPLNGGRLVLEARNPSRNIARSWRIEEHSDLFGWTVIEWCWGRIGSDGQSRKVAFERADDAHCFVRRLLLRRASAERRIGVPYQCCN